MSKASEAVNGQQGSQRLMQALALLGYTNAQPRHHRSNLLSALRDFAALRGDTDTENACEDLLIQLRGEPDEPDTRAQQKIVPDELWRAVAHYPERKADAFLRTPSPSFSAVHPGLLESALQMLVEDAADGRISQKQSATALSYAVALMENGDYDTLARWLRQARKHAWSVPAQGDTP